MCGLIGTLLPEHLSKQQLQRIRQIFVANLLANEIRGPKATGVVVCQADGRVHFLKQPVPASEFVKTAVFQDFMINMVSPETRILLGHTREPTKGSVDRSVNNHPILIGDTVGVHNGVITNDDAIFLELSQNGAKGGRVGSVDSEAIFALFDGVDGDGPLDRYVAGISREVRALCGSFTTLFFNKKKPTRLFCLRYDNPISCHFDPALESLFFSSRYLFLRKTFGRAVLSEPLSGRTGFVFEAQGLRLRQKHPIASFRLKEV